MLSKNCQWSDFSILSIFLLLTNLQVSIALFPNISAFLVQLQRQSSQNRNEHSQKLGNRRVSVHSEVYHFWHSQSLWRQSMNHLLVEAKGRLRIQWKWEIVRNYFQRAEYRHLNYGIKWCGWSLEVWPIKVWSLKVRLKEWNDQIQELKICTWVTRIRSPIINHIGAN